MIPDARRRLEDLLDREIEFARVLAGAIADEKAALTGDSPAAVEKTAAEKIRVLETIEHLEQERRALCASPASPGIAATVVERWRRLMELMARCRAANEVNGHIIHVRRHQIRQLIDIVRGGPSITYDPHGKTFTKALRAIARA
ncbi:MAG TPA: flagellar protein FlgN [Steroidobacteraceae bacterium]|jgi:flagellar biosynthesis/type III secretory pathway chaperone|nr:flagellar protein FlgN [Steroidobacteraceae bacterium]